MPLNDGMKFGWLLFSKWGDYLPWKSAFGIFVFFWAEILTSGENFVLSQVKKGFKKLMIMTIILILNNDNIYTIMWFQVNLAIYNNYNNNNNNNDTNYIAEISGAAGGVMVIVVGNGHGDTSSNPERNWLHFT